MEYYGGHNDFGEYANIVPFDNVARTSSTYITLGPTLDLLPKYAFAVPPTTTSLTIPNYPGIIRPSRSNANNYAYFNVGQFANIKINEYNIGIFRCLVWQIYYIGCRNDDDVSSFGLFKCIIESDESISFCVVF